VNDRGGVEILHALYDLVHNVSVVYVFEDFLSDSIVKICLHKLEYQVKVFVVVCFEHVMKLDDMVVLEL